MSIKKEYTVERDGKTFVLYAGLLDAAHELGLLSIETALAQIPSAENGNTAVCIATVRLADKDGATKTFMGIGDANPGNVNRMMAPHIIRMAETRAKARALRDAINVSEALDDDPTEDQEAEQEAHRTNGKAPAPSTTRITAEQLKARYAEEARKANAAIEACGGVGIAAGVIEDASLPPDAPIAAFKDAYLRLRHWNAEPAPAAR